MQHQSDDVIMLRWLRVTLQESVEGYSDAARESDEILRPIFIGRTKERQEMANEFGARIATLGGVVEGEIGQAFGFASKVRNAGGNGADLLNIVETFEASLRSDFLTALNDNAASQETRAFLQSQFLVIERSQNDVRKLRNELGSGGE